MSNNFINVMGISNYDYALNFNAPENIPGARIGFQYRTERNFDSKRNTESNYYQGNNSMTIDIAHQNNDLTNNQTSIFIQDEANMNHQSTNEQRSMISINEPGKLNVRQSIDSEIIKGQDQVGQIQRSSFNQKGFQSVKNANHQSIAAAMQRQPTRQRQHDVQWAKGRTSTTNIRITSAQFTKQNGDQNQLNNRERRLSQSIKKDQEQSPKLRSRSKSKSIKNLSPLQQRNKKSPQNILQKQASSPINIKISASSKKFFDQEPDMSNLMDAQTAKNIRLSYDCHDSKSSDDEDNVKIDSTNDEVVLENYQQSNLVEEANKRVRQIQKVLSHATNPTCGEEKYYIALQQKQDALMESIKQQWRVVNQNCQRLLTGHDDYPELFLDKPTGIFISQKTNLYYRIEVKGMPSPLKCEITYTNIQAKVSNLDIYLSTECKEPSYYNHELRFRGQTPKFFINASKIGMTCHDKIQRNIENMKGASASNKNEQLFQMMQNTQGKGEQVFQDHYMYIGFTSDLQDISFTIKISPVESRQNMNKIKLEQYKKDRSELLNNIERVIRNDSYYDDMLQLKNEQREFQMKHKQYIQKHGFRIYYPNPQRVAQKIKNHKEKLQQGQSRKEQIEQEDRKMKLFQLVKHQHIQAFKNDLIDKRVAELRAIKYRTLFIRIHQTHQIMVEIFNAFMNRKIQKKIQIMAMFITIQYRARFLRQIRCRGLTVTDRNKTLGRNCLTFLGTHRYRTTTNLAKPLVYNIIRDWCAHKTMMKHFNDLINIFKKMAQYFKATILTRKQQTECIYHFWTKKKSELVIMLQHRQATEAQKKLHAKVLQLGEQRHDYIFGTDEYNNLPIEQKAKQIVLNTYVKRQRLDSLFRFMEWYVQKERETLMLDQGYKPSNKFGEYQKRISEIQDEISKLDYFLEKDVKNDLITWSEKAKKERRAKGSGSKKKGGRASSKESKKDKAQVEKAESMTCCGQAIDKQEGESLLSNMPKYELIRKDPKFMIVENQDGKDKKINVCIRRLIARAAMLTDKDLLLL